MFALASVGVAESALAERLAPLEGTPGLEIRYAAESALGTVRITLLGADEVQITVGPHDHCAGQPRQYADALQGLRQLSIQPTGIDSCIAWFSVDVFVNDAGEIEAVMLDLFGP